MSAKQAFKEWIQEQRDAVAAYENKAAQALEKADPVEYREQMRLKAELLAALLENGESRLGAMPEAEAAPLRSRLRRFAASASNALRLGSVFYMSALLYPEDHQPGQPNDLDVWLAEL